MSRALLALLLVAGLASAPAAAPATAAEGRIAYSRCALTGGVQYWCHASIWVMNGDGTGQRRVTRSHGAEDTEPAWSPDGRSIAFTRERRGEGRTLFVVDADGGRERVLAQGGAAAWSPDGSRIAFTHNGIWTIGADGSGRRLVTRKGGEPSWSPDGNELAYVVYNGRHTEVRVRNLATRDERVLSLPHQPAHGPVWSPDGQTIAYYTRYSTASGAWVVPSAGGTPLKLPLEEVGPVAWSPDGRELAFVQFADGSKGLDFEIFRAELDGTHQRRLTRTLYPETDPAWTP